MAKTGYETYIRTDELLALQKPESERVTPDELLFQVTHQTAELWMKVVACDLERARTFILGREPLQAAHLLRRSAQIMALLAQQLPILEAMPQADYHLIRSVLGRASGQESPGFNHLLTQVAGPLWEAYEGLLRESGRSVLDVLRTPQAAYEMWLLTDAMMEYDESFQKWRYDHFALVRRIIGQEVLSLKGIPASQLIHGTTEELFPPLWQAVNALTRETRPTY